MKRNRRITGGVTELISARTSNGTDRTDVNPPKIETRYFLLRQPPIINRPFNPKTTPLAPIELISKTHLAAPVKIMIKTIDHSVSFLPKVKNAIINRIASHTEL